MVGRLERVDLRMVWKSEASDFTTWLSDNLDILSDHIDCELNFIEREKRTGTFSADIAAEGPNGEPVVIENQLEKTDHDHLGKLITYLSNLDAKIAIWITSNPRPEHLKAISYLNEISPSDTSFYLVKVEAYAIGDSEPAPLFTTISGPSPEAKEAGDQKQELAERYQKRMKFWEKLLARASTRTPLHSNVSKSTNNYLVAGAGRSGLGWAYSITMNNGSVELAIDLGPDKEEKTHNIYNFIYEQKDAIEASFGQPIEWDKKEGRRICRIKSFTLIGGLKDMDKWDEIQDDMIDKMIRLEKVLKPIILDI